MSTPCPHSRRLYALCLTGLLLGFTTIGALISRLRPVLVETQAETAQAAALSHGAPRTATAAIRGALCQLSS